MSSLKDKIGQWVNIEVSVDNTARRAEVFVDGELETSVESESFSKRITKTANSKFTIGSSKNKQKGFRGRFQNFEVKKGKATREMVKLRYQNKTKKSRTLFNMDFKNVVGSGSSRKFLDKGKKRMQVKSSGEFSTAPTVSQVSGSDAVALSIDESSGQGGLVVEETGGTFQNLEKSTFSAMVKLPAGHARDGFEPIMSKSDKFAFGVHEGKAALYMANQGNLVPYLGEKEEESGVVKADDDLLVEASFDGSSKYVSVEGTPEYALGINKSKAVKNEIKVHKNAIYGKDLDSFAVSMWVKPDELGESTLFERPDSELSMLTDAAGVLTLKSRPTELRIEDRALVRYVRFSLNAPSSAPDKPASAFALNLYEFRVYDDTGALVSYNKPTSASSHYKNLDMYHPELATDDPQDDPYINKTGFHSKHTDGTDWIEIDLGEKKTISRVLLVNYYDVSTASSQGVYMIDRIAQGGGYLTFKAENQEELKVSQELYWDGPLTGRYAYEYDVKSSTWDGRNDTRASGGDEVFNVGENRVHKFTSSGTFKTNKPVEITYLVVGGGGAGGSDRGGGGGGGGLRQGSIILPAGSYPITVGAGGVPKDQYQSGGKGGSSSLGDIVSVSGGGGGGGEASAPSSGGSGGGSTYGYGNLSGASGIPGEGNAGSDGWNGMGQRTTGGGGGALMPGRGGKPDYNPERPDGGRGFKSIITGTIVGYGGGGGGGATDGDHGGHSGSRGLATDGGGHGGLADSAGGYGFEGVDGLGGGGGGGAGGGSSAHGTDTTNGRKGGSGVVIISYKYVALPESYGFGGDVFEVNGYRVHAFIGSTNAFINPVSRPVDVLLVGGGGGGGSDNAGGGGAGGLVFKPNHTISAGTHQVTVGRGGRGAANHQGVDSAENGFDTSFAGLIAKGGGRGGSGNPPRDNHLPGGSGGGAQGEATDYVAGKPGIQSLQDGDSATYGYGNAGGDGSLADAGGGGGGGAGGPGENGRDPLGGAGGIGKYQVFDESSQTTFDFAQMFGMKYGEQDGNKIYFAGGGAGANKNYTNGTVLGGKGGGGDQYGSSTNPQDGGHNTGGGGAGSALMNPWQTRPDSGGATGGTGIVLLRYPIAQSIAPRENVYEFIVNKHNESSIGIHINHINMDGHDIHPDDVTWVYPPDRHNTGADALKHNDLAGAWNKSYNEGQTIFTVTTRREVKLFNIYYSRIRYRPGWLIKKNGVTVVKEDDNPGDALEPGWAQYAMDKPYYENVQDTYSRYPPFDMTTDSQSGYVVSSSTDAYHTTNFEQWAAFSFSNTSGWHSGHPYPGDSTRWTGTFKGDSAGATYDVNANGNFGHTKTSFAGIDGEWIKMQMPHKIVLSKFFLRHRHGQGDNYSQAPRDFKVFGSEDDSNWDLICDYVGQDSPSEGRYFDAPAKKAYKYFTFLVTRVQRNNGQVSMLTIKNLIYYGRLEGDPVREIPLVYWNNANRPFDPMIGTRGYNLDANREELFTSNGWIDPANQTNLMDGSSTTLYATSATQLKADYPSLGDGLYYYKIPGTSTVKALYTDMTRNGGGWVCISKWGGHGKTDEKVYNINERQLNVLQTNTFGSVHDYARLSMDHMNRIWPESQYVLRIHFWSQKDITYSHYRSSGVYFQSKLNNQASFDLWKAHYSPLYWSDFRKFDHSDTTGGGTNYSVVYDDHNTSAGLSTYTGASSAFDPTAERGTQAQIKSTGGRQGGRNASMGWWDDWAYNGSYGPGGSWQAARHMGFFGDITQGNQWLFTNNFSDSRWNASEDRKTMIFIRW